MFRFNFIWQLKNIFFIFSHSYRPNSSSNYVIVRLINQTNFEKNPIFFLNVTNISHDKPLWKCRCQYKSNSLDLYKKQTNRIPLLYSYKQYKCLPMCMWYKQNIFIQLHSRNNDSQFELNNFVFFISNMYLLFIS